jgi:cytochrome c oxidase assembly protein subunit 11
MVAQAVPSVSPGMGASYFNKIECFCFNQQPLEALAQAEMPLIFYIEPDIPEEIHTLTLSYTLYDITPELSSNSAPVIAKVTSASGKFPDEQGATQ